MGDGDGGRSWAASAADLTQLYSCLPEVIGRSLQGPFKCPETGVFGRHERLNEKLKSLCEGSVLHHELGRRHHLGLP